MAYSIRAVAYRGLALWPQAQPANYSGFPRPLDTASQKACTANGGKATLAVYQNSVWQFRCHSVFRWFLEMVLRVVPDIGRSAIPRGAGGQPVSCGREWTSRNMLDFSLFMTGCFRERYRDVWAAALVVAGCAFRMTVWRKCTAQCRSGGSGYCAGVACYGLSGASPFAAMRLQRR